MGESCWGVSNERKRRDAKLIDASERAHYYS